MQVNTNTVETTFNIPEYMMICKIVTESLTR